MNLFLVNTTKSYFGGPKYGLQSNHSLSVLSSFAIDPFLPSGLHCLNYLDRPVSGRSLSDCLIVLLVLLSETTEVP